MRVWDAATGQEIRTLKRRKDLYVPLGLAFSPDGTNDSPRVGAPARWRCGMLRPVGRSSPSPGTRRTLLEASRLALTAGTSRPPAVDRTVKLWDAATGKEIRTLNGHTDMVACVTFSPDGQRLASGGFDGEVKVWDARAGQETLTLKEQTGIIACVAFSPDGHRLASASDDGTVKVWDARPLDDEPAKRGPTPR